MNCSIQVALAVAILEIGCAHTKHSTQIAPPLSGAVGVRDIAVPSQATSEIIQDYTLVDHPMPGCEVKAPVLLAEQAELPTYPAQQLRIAREPVRVGVVVIINKSGSVDDVRPAPGWELPAEDAEFFLKTREAVLGWKFESAERTCYHLQPDPEGRPARSISRVDRLAYWRAFEFEFRVVDGHGSVTRY